MMNKQIEEMEKDIAIRMAGAKSVAGSMNNGVEGWLGKYLIERGWTKIHESAVVLTEGEYKDLISDEVKTIERDIAEYWVTQDVESVAKELHKDGYRKLDDHAIFVLRKAKCLEYKIRKETADKFAERVKMAFYYEFDELIPSIMSDKIDEIAKEITGGEKEISNETV
jgi:hypothetical protein